MTPEDKQFIALLTKLERKINAYNECTCSDSEKQVDRYCPIHYPTTLEDAYQAMKTDWKFDNDELHSQEGINRVEVIDETGRAYVKYFTGKCELSYQDEGKTLKVFITPEKK